MNSPAAHPHQHVVQRRQLPLPTAYVSPRTATEQRLVEIWRTVLSMDFVGVDDDYNDLGGDSLQAVAIFSLIDQAFRVSIPMGALVEAPSIAQLARRIDAVLPGTLVDRNE